MIQDIRLHTSHYAILAAWLSAMLISFMAVLDNEMAEMMVVVITGIGYVVWGISHHYFIGDLTLRLIAEYLLFATIAVAILVMVLTNR